MRLSIPFKPKSTLALLIIAIVVNAFSIFIIFPRIETIIHGDLYQYGLQFSLEWVSPLRDSSYLFLNCLKIAMILMVLSALTLVVYIRSRIAVLKAVSSVLVTVGAGMTLFSLYSFYRIDQVVNEDLYSFGLQVSGEWYASYKLYSVQLVGFVGFASAAAAVSIVLIYLSTRKKSTLVPENLANSILIISGTTFLALAIIYTSSILVLVGLGMLSWGLIFNYISNEQYVKKVLLDKSTSSQLSTANKVIQDRDFVGNAVFLPPRYFKVPETYKAYIPREKTSRLPSPEMFYRKDPRFSIEFIETPPAILVTPPGAELVRLFEKTLKKEFSEVDMKYLEVNLPNLLVGDLEIARNFEMNVEKEMIRVIINGSVYETLPVDEQNVYFTFSSPLASAIAFVLTKSINKPVLIKKPYKPIIIKRQLTKEEAATVTVEYQILEDKGVITS